MYAQAHKRARDERFCLRSVWSNESARTFNQIYTLIVLQYFSYYFLHNLHVIALRLPCRHYVEITK